MTGDRDAGARRALMEVDKQSADQGQRGDAAAKINAWLHPFDWQDLLLITIPIATTVLTMWWDAPW